MNTLKTLAAAVALAALGATAPAAFAQATGGTPQGATQGAQQGAPAGQMGGAQTEISEEDLQKFSKADSAVGEIRDDFSQRLSQAENQEEAQSLQMEAQEKMVEAVQSEGLEIPKYNEIATRMQSDPELQQRVQSMN
ncbi:DUF4168 domain-containing protein [Pseudomonas sp. gcc21]|uniref:DUF4168 domain-containing protein n=1 Tax=Pseudomonas sp. gcc21 TaxID=2726989 RepID=UPI0014520EBD|nr:DUF4168 domain-containing protein [Pseudomonas sp. gcc21]QJD58799.1 DUF4168 domain-containing protein [Pseudomonas sp. gcc21]